MFPSQLNNGLANQNTIQPGMFNNNGGSMFGSNTS